MSQGPFTDALAAELARRQRVNARFSVRAFARHLGMSHSAVSRLLRGKQRPSAGSVDRVARKLGWSPARVSKLIRREEVARLAAAVRAPGFAADARRISSRTNLSLDEVQLALHEALRTGRLVMTAPHNWKVSA